MKKTLLASLLVLFSFAAAPVAFAQERADAHAKPVKAKKVAEKSLYERLGGSFAIAAVVDHFSDAVVQNPMVGQNSQNPALREWHTSNLGRLPGLFCIYHLA